MSHALRDIQRYLFQHARRQPARPVPQLMRFVTDWTILNAAWRQVRRSQGRDTPGADQVVAGEAFSTAADLRAWLQELAAQLQSGAYQPGNVRRFEIAKPGKPGEFRPIAILTVQDRVAHMALKLVLEPIIESRLGKRCFGFRAGLSRFDELNAIRRVVQNHPGTFAAALTADIASCFDQLDQHLVLQDLRAVAADPNVVELAHRILEQVGSSRQGWWNRRPVGVLQGSPLSPLLANWTLARFDRAWTRRSGEPAPMFRYADDIVVLAGDPRAARKLLPLLEGCLWHSNRLELAKEKTVVTTFDDGVPLLGLMIRRRVDPFDAVPRIRMVVDPAKIREILEQVHQWAEELDPDRSLRSQFARFNQRLRGWFESYQFAHDSAAAIETIDQHVFARLRARLKPMLGATWAQLQERHYHRLPTGHHTWQADGVPLMVLSALPRRFYRPKLPRSPWDKPHRPSANIGPTSATSRDLGLGELYPLANARISPTHPVSDPNTRPGASHDRRSSRASQDPDHAGIAPTQDSEASDAVDRNGVPVEQETSQGGHR